MTCDFCGDETIKRARLYDCGRFTVHSPNGNLITLDKGWAACNTCASLIDNNNQDGLLKRALESHAPYIEPGKMKETIEMLNMAYIGFFLSRKER